MRSNNWLSNTHKSSWRPGMTASVEDRPLSRRAYVPTSALAKAVEFSEEMMHVQLTDGRILSVPLIWIPSLRAATSEQRNDYRIGAGGRGVHWPQIDED